MRFLHLSDLHLGKRVHNFSMIEDQRYILERILEIAEEEKISSVIVSGDVYDKPVPSAEAVKLFDEFLVSLSEKDLNVFVISGNHDSPERIAFGEKLMQKSRVFMSPVYDGSVKRVTVSDEYGEIDVHLLPFIKPVHVRHFYEEEEITDYTKAMECVIAHMQIDTTKRNILVCHQFVTGALRSESEEISVGGLDNVEAMVFEAFDYVALGHIHRPQNVGSEKIRYCGTPLKYSFSEADHTKSVTIIDMKEKENITVSTRELRPLRDMRKVKGMFGEVISEEFVKETDVNSYLQVSLLDENDVPNAFGKLATVYPNLMLLQYENQRTKGNLERIPDVKGMDISPVHMFEEFYEKMNANQPMSDEQSAYILSKIETIWGIENET